jgi:lactate dehydrogenase-like 2-hydroxyacid dehydrogenase
LSGKDGLLFGALHDKIGDINEAKRGGVMATKPIRIFVTADIGESALERLRERGYEVEVFEAVEPPPKSLIIEKVRGGIDGLITTLRDRIDEEVFASGRETLRVVAQLAVGIDNIDRAAANRYRIPFTNTPDVLTEATAEFALFMLGAVSRRLYSSEALVRECEWGYWHPYRPFLGDEVTGKTVAVIGAGRIGRALARKCIGLDMNILLHTAGSRDERFVAYADREMQLRYDAGFSRRRCAVSYVTFDEALARGDYVSLHVPLVPHGQATTVHLINQAALNRMKPTAYLINTSRGPVVDERALHDALINNRIAGAALDVFDREPLPVDSLLRDERLKDRLRLFHHFASGTRETRLSPDADVGMAGRCVQGVIDVIEGRYDGDTARMPFVVNKEAFE